MNWRRLLFGSLRARMTFAVGLAVALMMAGLVLSTTRQQIALVKEYQMAQATSFAVGLAHSSAVWLAARDLAGLQEIVNGLSEYPGLRHAMVLDLQGRILAHNEGHRRGLFLADLPERPEVQVLQRTASLIDVAAPVVLGGNPVGWVRIGLDGRELESGLRSVRQQGVLYGVLAIVLSVAVVWWLAWQVTRRLHAIQQVASSVHGPVTGLRAEVSGEDETARLAACFNEMLDNLAAQQTELQRYQQHLESEVSERTLALTLARDEAEAASRAKSQFLANMSHELRTPMNAIMGMTDLALRRTHDPDLEDKLRKIAAASRHLLHVINDILDISRIEADRMVIEQVRFLLGEVFENLGSLIAHRAESKGLRFHIELPPGLAAQAVLGDPVRLEQVLLNLAGNAVKFTEHGEVVLRVALVDETADTLTLRFAVTDTGPGIAPADLGRLFQVFGQLDGSMTRKYGGSGLGLAISQRLVRLMGSDILVDSRPGEGSTFSFALALVKAAPENAPSAVVDSSTEAVLRQRFAGTRLLLAEDEPVNREVSRGLLEDIGLQVDVAEDGVEALDLARRNRYALILMDMQMPNLNGVDATRAIRQLSSHARTPIVAMTANAFEEDRQACLAAGMNDHLAKPIDPDLLFSTLLRWLSAKPEETA